MLMNHESFRKYCLSLKGVEEDLPFDDVTPVFKVMGKMFALIDDSEKGLSINLKCDPDKAIELRASYPAVLPGYHMNKAHWNTIYCDGSIEDELILRWTKDSYELVVAKLTGRLKNILRNM
jgi:predicted DNA-binding protein (MmcQ/YjbR family)